MEMEGSEDVNPTSSLTEDRLLYIRRERGRSEPRILQGVVEGTKKSEEIEVLISVLRFY